MTKKLLILYAVIVTAIAAVQYRQARTLRFMLAHPRLEVKWFGAKGDGVTDDTVAIQTAIDVICRIPQGGVLLFSDGMYSVGLNDMACAAFDSRSSVAVFPPTNSSNCETGKLVSPHAP